LIAAMPRVWENDEYNSKRALEFEPEVLDQEEETDYLLEQIEEDISIDDEGTLPDDDEDDDSFDEADDTILGFYDEVFSSSLISF
jgi:hypothetical protein